MRLRLATGLIFLGLAPAWTASATPPEVTVRYRPESDFRRLAELWTGREETGSCTIVRTAPDTRAGWYWEIELPRAEAAEVRTVVVEAIASDALAPRQHSFPLPAGATHPRLQLGWTGPTAPDAQTPPLAWKVSLQRADGSVAAERASFLWAYPDQP